MGLFPQPWRFQLLMGLFVLLLRMQHRQELMKHYKISPKRCEAQNGNLSDALKLFKTVLEVIPEHIDARRNLAKVYLELGNIEQAEKELEICIQINPKDCWSYIMMGNIYTKHKRDLNIAEFYYECGLEHHPEDGMLLNNYANLMMEKGNFSKAEQLFKKTLNLRPVHPNSYFGLALLYRVRAILKKALKCLNGFLC
jgi:tetratricopeptide (TPR) repeat protein